MARCAGLCCMFIAAVLSFSGTAYGNRSQTKTFHPSVLIQLEPYFGGINRSTLASAKTLYLKKWTGNNRTQYDVPGYPAYDYARAESMSGDDPDFPWSHTDIVKVVAVGGQLWLPGGRIPISGHGFSFSRQADNLLWDLVELNEVQPLPDMEFFVSSASFALVEKRNPDGTALPVFKASGSKHAFDLVLPDAGWRVGGPSGSKLPFIPWNERRNAIVARYNNMCPRGELLHTRGQRIGEQCARKAFHHLNGSEANAHGALDAGAVSGIPESDTVAPRMDAKEQAQAKYALCLDGATIAYRLRHLLDGGQAIIQDDTSPMFGWYHKALQPWIHYIPFTDEYKTIFDLAKFLFSHDQLAANIASNGRAFAQSLTKKTAQSYSRFLLVEYSKLLTEKPPALGKQAMLLADAMAQLKADTQDPKVRQFKTEE